jgi:hypothetical protein
MSEHRPAPRRPELWKLFVWGAVFVVFVVTKGQVVWIAARTDPTTTLAIACVITSFAVLLEGAWRRYVPARRR